MGGAGGREDVRRGADAEFLQELSLGLRAGAQLVQAAGVEPRVGAGLGPQRAPARPLPCTASRSISSSSRLLSGERVRSRPFGLSRPAFSPAQAAHTL